MTASDGASIAPLLSSSSSPKAFSYDADVAAFLRAHTSGMSVAGAPLRVSAPGKASKAAAKASKPAKTAAPSASRSAPPARDAADAKSFEYDQDVAAFLRRFGAGGNGQAHAPGVLKNAQPDKTTSENKVIRRLFRRSG
jgi:hypothetical protein